MSKNELHRICCRSEWLKLILPAIIGLIGVFVGGFIIFEVEVYRLNESKNLETKKIIVSQYPVLKYQLRKSYQTYVNSGFNLVEKIDRGKDSNDPTEDFQESSTTLTLTCETLKWFVYGYSGGDLASNSLDTIKEIKSLLLEQGVSMKNKEITTQYNRWIGKLSSQLEEDIKKSDKIIENKLKETN